MAVCVCVFMCSQRDHSHKDHSYNPSKLLHYDLRYKKLGYRWQTAWCVLRSVKVTRHGTIRYVRYGACDFLL